MQHLDTEPARRAPGLPSMPRITIPWKLLAMLLFGLAILAVLGILMLDNSDMHSQLSAAQASVQFLNDSKANRDGVLLQFSQDNFSISRLTENVTQLQKLVIDPSASLVQFNSSLQDTRDQMRTLSNLYSILHSEVANLTENFSNWTLSHPADSPVQNNPYLCDTSGVPASLLFQYNFSCTCTLREKYGPYLNLGSACNVNRDPAACECYYSICDSHTGLC